MYMSLIKRMPKFSADVLRFIVEALRTDEQKVFVIDLQTETAYRLTSANGMDAVFQPTDFVKAAATAGQQHTHLIAGQDYNQYVFVIPTEPRHGA